MLLAAPLIGGCLGGGGTDHAPTLEGRADSAVLSGQVTTLTVRAQDPEGALRVRSAQLVRSCADSDAGIHASSRPLSGCRGANGNVDVKSVAGPAPNVRDGEIVQANPIADNGKGFAHSVAAKPPLCSVATRRGTS